MGEVGGTALGKFKRHTGFKREINRLKALSFGVLHPL
jgi:hypothetical protein